MSDDQKEKSRCISCGREINNGAIKCAECGSFQNWRRYLQFSTTVLSLVVALISVSGLVIPLLIESFQKEESAVMVTFRSATIKEVTKIVPRARRADEIILENFKISVRILLTNTGQKSGFLDSAVLRFELEEGNSFNVVLKVNPSEAVVKSGMFAVIDISAFLPSDSMESPGTLLLRAIRSARSEEHVGLLILKIVRHDLNEKPVEIAIPASAWQQEPREIR